MRWSYDTFAGYPDEVEKFIKIRGKDSWELVSVVKCDGSFYRAYLKKPLTEEGPYTYPELMEGMKPSDPIEYEYDDDIPF